jgi:hypothetical protein
VSVDETALPRIVLRCIYLSRPCFFETAPRSCACGVVGTLLLITKQIDLWKPFSLIDSLGKLQSCLCPAYQPLLGRSVFDPAGDFILWSDRSRGKCLSDWSRTPIYIDPHRAAQTALSLTKAMESGLIVDEEAEGLTNMILVMGVTGSGKSRFINTLVSGAVEECGGLYSGERVRGGLSHRLRGSS